MSFGTAISTCLRKYADFSGRATRPEYWWFFLFTGLVTIAAAVVDDRLGLSFTDSSADGYVSVVVLLALLLPSLAVGARRLRDAGVSPWWLLIYLVPCGAIALLVMLARPSRPEPNEHGAQPV